MKLEHALAIVQTVIGEAGGPVSVFVADAHGELVAAATMDGAAPDTRLNAQRKAYTAARSDALSTRDLGAKVKDDPVELASFDPFFTFFQGGVAAFEGARRVGAVGVSGLPGSEDDRSLARRSRRPGSPTALAETGPPARQKIAIGLNGEPVPPGRRSGCPTTMNSKRPSSSQASAISSSWRLSETSIPIATIWSGWIG